MLMIAVQSSTIARVGYDSATKDLAIDFVNGNRYTYHDVPIETWSALMKAPSPGRYFGEQIRDAYSFTRGAAPSAEAD
jgi:hypothetical protein